MALEIVTVPCLTDNYAYLIHDPAAHATAVVDVPDEMPIEAELERRGWRLTDILLTHHHADHTDGAAALKATTGARVVGAAMDAGRLPPLDLAVQGGETFLVGSLEVEVIAAPGHTSGHIAFHLPAAAAVFTADSLMALGCGRLFEGTPAQMWDSLSRLSRLPAATTVHSGHEYTASNARFAMTIERDNPALISRVEKIGALRQEGRPTVPSTLSDELATNPFLRAHLPAVKAAIGLPGATDAEAFAEIRRRKDVF